MAQSILEDALKDAEILKETAIKTARNVLVEAISPQIREFMDSQMGGGDIAGMPAELADIDPEVLKQILSLLAGGEDSSMAPEAPGLGGPEDSGMDFGAEKESPFGLGDEEEDPLEDGMYEGRGAQDEDEDEEKDDMSEEVVKIDESDLAAAWAEVVKEEALDEAAQVPSPTVSGDFADVQNPNSLAKGGLGDAGTPGDRGLEDKEKEEMWKDDVPPAAQDWTVKEAAYKRQLKAIAQQNKKLHNENSQLNIGVQKLQRSLTEVNLFNSKLLHTNKLLQSMNLNTEQRLTVIEAIDRANNLHEVELVYTSLSESFKIAGVTLNEGKQTNKRQRSSRFTTSATANMLREHSGKTSGGDELITEANRWCDLAGVLGD